MKKIKHKDMDAIHHYNAQMSQPFMTADLIFGDECFSPLIKLLNLCGRQSKDANKFFDDLLFITDKDNLSLTAELAKMITTAVEQRILITPRNEGVSTANTPPSLTVNERDNLKDFLYQYEKRRAAATQSPKNVEEDKEGSEINEVVTELASAIAHSIRGIQERMQNGNSTEGKMYLKD